jgi:lysophospholipase L1-like esterase
MPSLLRKLGLAVAVLVGAAVAAELGYRVLGPRPYAAPVVRDADGNEKPLSEIAAIVREWSERRPAETQPCAAMPPHMRVLTCYDRPELPYFDAQGCVEVRTNRYGFRDREFELAKRAGEFRVLALGDSFTFGNGVRVEDSWPEQLELLLSARFGSRIEVINGGFATGSHSPAGYGDWLESDGLAFQPDVVIVGLCLNDLHMRVPMLAYPIAQPEPWLFGASRLLYRFQCAREQRMLIEAPKPDAALLIAFDPAPAEASHAGLVRMRDLCRARGVRYVVAVFPMLSLLGKDYPYLGLHRLVAEICTAEQIDCVDLLDRFRGRDEHQLWVHPTDQHPNPAGHRLIAQGIYDFLTR